MIPHGWKHSTLGCAVLFHSGGTPSKQNTSYWGGNFPWVSAKDLKQHYIDSSQLYLTEEGKRFSKKAPVGSTLILVRGMTLLKDVPIGFVRREVAFNQDIKALIPKDGIDPTFISYLLVERKLHLRALVNTANHGTGRLDTKLLHDLQIVVPPLEEQQRIAEIVSTWDRAIEATEKLIANSEAQKKALMQQLLTGKKRLPGFDGAWSSASIEELFDVITGKSKSAAICQDGQFRIVDMGAINRHSLLCAQKRINSRTDPLLMGDLVMPKDDIGGGQIIGRVAYIPNDEEFELGDHVYVLRTKSNQTSSLYFYYQINSPQVRLSLRRKANGTAQLGLGGKDVRKQKVFLPTLAEQAAIAKVLATVDKKIERLNIDLSRLRNEKLALMQQLLTGKRRVKVEETAV